MSEEKMISIWTMVGIILLIYGLIITGCGVYYSMNGLPTTVAGETNPSLWWGLIMLIASVVMMFAGKTAQKRM